MSIADVLIETDSRGRTNLSRFAKNARFLAHQEDDGTIVLEPARLITAAADRLRRNPHTMDKLAKAHENIHDTVQVDLI
jgi:hypothetical protein